MTERMTLARARMLAIQEAIDWLAYRAEVCRREEERHHPMSRGAATERSARMEIQLAVREIAAMANEPRLSRKLKEQRESRAAYLAQRPDATGEGR